MQSRTVTETGRMLLTIAKARRALNNPDLPEELKALYKVALDRGEAALSLQKAAERRGPDHK